MDNNASYRIARYVIVVDVPVLRLQINFIRRPLLFHDTPGLYLAGSDAFLPSVVGAMYGGCLGACAVLGQLGSLRLGHALLCHLAKHLQEENPKLSWGEAYLGAINKFIN